MDGIHDSQVLAGDQRLKMALCRQRMVAARRALDEAQGQFDEAFRQFELLTDETLPFPGLWHLGEGQLMHFCGYVIGPDPDEQMAPFSEHIEVEPWVDTCWCVDEKGQPRPGHSSCEGTGKYLTRRNPKGEWDYFRIGGRWSGALKVHPGMPGVTGATTDGWDAPKRTEWTDRYDQALAGHIDWTEVTAPYFLVIEGSWKAKENWTGGAWVPVPFFEQFYERTIPNLAPDTLVTVVDIHS